MPSLKKLPRLSPMELQVMRVFWEKGRKSAREVHQHLAGDQGWAYSTTRTHLDRMVKKGLVSKAPFHGLHLYGAAISRPQGLAQRVLELARLALGGNPVPVVALFAQEGDLSEEEIAELRQLVDGETCAGGRTRVGDGEAN